MKSYISAAVIFAALLVTVPAAPLAVSELRHTSAAEPTAAVYKSENSEKETKKQTEVQEPSENSKKENEKENKKITQEEIKAIEEKAKKILEECTHKTVDVVLDPTLFVDSDFYDTLLKGYKCEYLAVKEKYMLAVFYGRKNLSKFRKSAEKLAQKFSLPLKIINVNFGAAAYASNLINDAGPLDFLSLIKNAECVCTNSFHNMAFALIYDRPFYVFEDNALDVRKVGILKTLKLQDRIVYGDDISSITKLDCDFKENKLILDHLKLQSFAFLDQIDRLGSIQI